MTTITFRASIGSSQRLERSVIASNVSAYWPTDLGYTSRDDDVAYGQTQTLDKCSTLIVMAPAEASIVVGWTPVSGGPVEFPLNQLAVLSPPTGSTPYVRNSSTISSSAPIPVQTIAVR